jgi:hypothetical protein
MKKITNFLKAIKPASGITVTQKDDRILMEHIKNEYGRISFNYDRVNYLNPPILLKSNIIIIRCMRNVFKIVNNLRWNRN